MICLCGQFFVADDVVFLGDTGVQSLGDGSRIRISRTEDDEMVYLQERLVHARECFLTVNEVLMLLVDPCQAACASLHRAGCLFGVFKPSQA